MARAQPTDSVKLSTTGDIVSNLSSYDGRTPEPPYPTDPEDPLSERERWQDKCLALGFQYWRAPDAHGVTCTPEQAIEFMQEVIGVEVEIKMPIVDGWQTFNCGKCGTPNDVPAYRPKD